MSRDEVVEELWQNRPRSKFVRASLWAVFGLMILSWALGEFDWADLFSPRRRANLARFLVDVRPYPLQGVDWDWGIAWSWGRDLFAARGAEAARTTLGISLLAILLAGVLSIGLSLPAARNFASPEPFLPLGRPPSLWLRLAWSTVCHATRFVLILLRAIPEYLAAFLLLAILGPTPWTAIIALTIHNAGILGRLGAESIENIPIEAPRSLRALGAGRMRIASWIFFPELLPRLLLYFFYRWETCVRESTVLGLLGIVSLGFWIDDARTRGQMDVLVYFVILGVMIVIIGDIVSSLAREFLRRAN
ncbi:MAG: ABC transporter permease subunit [Myxococcales bacterium]|nr:ABC transporter permease subunit [Myxococcales bacterium]